MAIASNVYARTAIDFVHDVSAGLFPGAVLSAWLIRGRFVSASPDSLEALAKASTSLWIVLFVALAAIIVTGAIRLSYWKLNVRSGFMEAKVRMAQIKHAAFVLVTIASIVVMFSLLG